ncbi:MBL fold metallo-hydrolase [Sphingomonas sp.]|uniref:MBL fold metallo-hydrolase n=1 Tax=Sphingomonas sp. TaxID=28214 RepID=UPI002DD672AD|nr:MBL fold metallo-hydrolase [Sphingomonas sp.]
MTSAAHDPAIDAARAGCSEAAPRPDVAAFIDSDSNTISYIVSDPATRACAIIDSVLGFDAAAGRVTYPSVDILAGHVAANGLTVDWLLETHVHADHLSGATALRARTGGRISIGSGVRDVDAAVGPLFDCSGSITAFDRLFEDGEQFAIGDLQATVLAVPGHTPACVAYAIGDALFCGDTMFMPDYGTARCDFPGGDAGTLFRSVRRLLDLPSAMRVFVAHDYPTPARPDLAWETTIGAQRADNIHVRDGTTEADFVAARTARDATLAMPQLILPSIQVNLRAGGLPAPAANGVRYLKLPLAQF